MAGPAGAGIDRLPVRALPFVLLLFAAACGPTGNSPPVLLGLEDREAVVDSELLIEIRASDPDRELLRFDFHSNAPNIRSRARLEPFGAENSVLFRWTPLAEDVGSWLFDFEVSDGANTTIETIAVDVRAAADGAPSFLRPLGAGTTLDLSTSDCLELAIEVEDQDSTSVTIAEEAPGIRGATLMQTSGLEATWSWCPSATQIEDSQSYVLRLSADDGDNPKTTKDFLIVLEGGMVIVPVDLSGYQLVQTGSDCTVTIPAGTIVDPGAGLVIARDSGRTDFESFWQVVLPAKVRFLNSGDLCPRINGDESYRLVDPEAITVDGATPPLGSGTGIQRISGALPASAVESWTTVAADPGEATPGTAAREPGSGRVFISEVSDASGSGNFVYEFVEITVD
jgi:hypothetical protein